MAENVAVQFQSQLQSLSVEFSAYPSADGLSVYFKDISLRMLAEAEVKAATEKYRNMFNLSPLPKWVFDIETLEILDVNDSALIHYGYSRKEFLEMKIGDLIPPADLNEMGDVLKETGKPASNMRTLRHVKKNGDLIYVNAKSNAVVFGGRKARIVLTQDITEKMAAEQALSASEQRFKALVQDGSDLIAILDTEGNYTYVSPTSKTILGLDSEFFLGRNAFDFIHPEDREKIHRQFLLLATKRTLKTPPFRFENANGQFRWIETTITDMTQDPAVSGIVANSKDITDMIKHELKMKEVIERFNIVSKATSDAIWDLDLKTKKTLWNKGIKGIFGYKLTADFDFDWWHERVHPEDLQRVLANVQRVIETRQLRWQDEYRFRCADGRYKHIFDRGFIVYDEQRQAIRMIGAMQDISERVSHLKAIESHNERLKEISWMQAHIVRSPLTRIMSLVSLLLANEEDEAGKKQILEYLKHSADDLDAVIKEIVSKSDLS